MLRTTSLTRFSLSTAAAVIGWIALPQSASAQVWQEGVNAPSDYNSSDNWTGFNVPDSPGKTATFASAGESGISIAAANSPQAWIFAPGSQNYTISGTTVNFVTGITNNANGVTITIGNTLTGTTLSQAGNSTLWLNGIGSSITNTSVTGGMLVNAAGGWLITTLANSATFTNAGILTGTVSNSGTFNNNPGGTVKGALTQSGGTTTNGGSIKGGVTLTGGAFTTTGTVLNGLSSTNATVNAQGNVSGAIVNAGSSVFTVTGALTGSSTFTNNGTAQLAVSGGNFTGITTLTNTSTSASAVVVSAGRTLSATTIANNAGTFTNSGSTTTTGGTTNAAGATFANTATGTLNGGVSNAGTASNAGTVNGALTNSGTFTQAAGSTNGTTNTGTINANGGAFNGATANNGGGVFNVGGTVTSDTTFNNAAGATLEVLATGNYTVTGLVTNGADLTVDLGGTLTAGGTTNNASFTNNGTTNGGVTNSGTYTQTAGSTNGGTTNTGTINANGGAFNGAIANNAGGLFSVGGAVTSNTTFNNASGATLDVLAAGNYTVTGLVTNGGNLTVDLGGTLAAAGIINNATYTNNGTTNGGVTNAGIGTNTGTLSGGVGNSSNFLNSGTVNGGLTNSGTYTQTAGSTNGGTSNTATINANGGAFNGAIANNAGGLFSVGGTVTSDTTFNNAGGATLDVLAAGNYTVTGLVTNGGNLTVDLGGRLTAGGTTSNATYTNNGTTNGGVTNAGTGTNAGTLNGGLTNSGTYTQTAGSTNGGTSNTGTINADGGAFNGAITNSTAGIFNIGGTVTSNSTFNNFTATSRLLINSGSYTTSGLITNSGTNAGGGILVAAGATLNASGGFTNNAGATIVNNGTFNSAGLGTNNGTFQGGLDAIGGTLTGTGSIVGATTISGGATFAPGSGAAGSSMSITGSLAFQSGSFYLVQVSPTTSSFANVTGSATLNGGTVNAVFAPGSYVVKQYTILHATTGVTGTFSGVSNSSLPSGFATTLSYDALNVYLNLNLFSMPSGLAGSQQNVANALTNYFNANGGIPMVFGALTPAGLSQAAGETATGSQQSTFNAMNQFMVIVTDPFVSGRGDPVSAGGSTTGYADAQELAYAAKRKPNDALAAIYTKASPPVPFAQRWSVWAAGFGGSQATDGNATLGASNTTSRVYGIAAGADYRISPDTSAGFALAGGGTNFSVNGFGSGRSDLFQAGAFVRHNAGPAYITAALAYGWQDVTTHRTVTIAGVDQLRARFNANAWSGRLEGGYRLVAQGIGLTPYAAGQFTTFELPSYAESVLSGANTFALAYAAKNVTAARSELGLRTDKSFAMQDAIFTLRGRAAWAHDYNADRYAAATFQTLPGATFAVNGAQQAHDLALATGSAEWKWLNGFSVAGTFEGEFSNVTKSYAGKGAVGYSW